MCALDGGEVVLERSFRTADVGADPAPLVEALVEHGPFELVLGPAGYGLPLVPGEQVGERELALMLLLREDEPHGPVGVGGMRAIVRALIAAGLPLVFGPGAIHLPTIPAYRKWNRIDLGTADKVASAALCIADQARRLGIDFAETSFVMLELGGAFSAALAVDGGRIVDGLGGSAGPIGARACGALDAEVAYLLGGALSKRTVFSGGALDPRGELDLSAGLAALRRDPRHREGWLALEEGAAKAALALTVSVPAPREILVAGRLAQAPGVIEALGERLAAVAPVPAVAGVGADAKAAAHGAAVLADGLAGGRYAALVERLGVARRERLRARPPQGARRRADPAALIRRRRRAIAHRRVMRDVVARVELAAQLAEQPEALGDDVVLVDRLEVLLARRDERVVAQAAEALDRAADRLAHAVLDEARAAVGLLDHRALVGALHQLVDLAGHRVLDDREQLRGVDVGRRSPRAARGGACPGRAGCAWPPAPPRRCARSRRR